MAVNPQAGAILEMMAQLRQKDISEQTVEEAREAMLAMRVEVEKPDVGKVEDRTIPGPGGEIPVRIYTPSAAGPHGALVFYHGGGWVLGDLEYCDVSCRLLAEKTPCVVISVDYRLAPETKFPGPVDDCYAALKWVAENASSIGVDPNKIAVGGDSAGGNLSAAVAIKTRDENGPKLAHQLLIYPVTDHAYETESYSANGEGYLLTKASMKWFWDHYLSGPQDSNNPLASPLRVSDASNLAPATVITAEYDPLRDEGEAYAKKLKDAGVKVDHRRYDGQIHGFYHMSAAIDDGMDAINWSAQQLKDAFSAVAV